MRHNNTINFLAALLLCLFITGCGSKIHLTFIANGESYSADDLTTLLSEANIENTTTVTVSEAPGIRIEMLAQLRQHGDDATALANTLTDEFPVDAAAIPIVVENALYEEKPAWIVIEAWSNSGTLTHRRLWVFSQDDQTLLAAHSDM